jgi:AcrR family transcriptional regulator
MPQESEAEKAIREAAEEIRRETRAAAEEVRVELGAAGRETRRALREAMVEVRAALSEIWGDEQEPEPAATGGRMSRAERKEMTRELLLDAAIDVFAEKGYHGASLDDVAEAAGFTKGAVYSNFTRKADVFRALLERETARSDLALRQVIEAVPLPLLPDVAGELLRRPERDPASLTLSVEFWLAAVRDPGLRPVLQASHPEVAALLDAKLAESGARPGLDGRELTVLIEALMTGLLMQRALDPEGDQPVLLAKALHRLIADVAPAADDAAAEARP